ncbi:putative 3-phosphoinositide-dependent protein kinase B [Blattamonas nauphoetae]|uniref:3-phosphoinositide-dependent protein kinase B n=1 Tax=Blattamonas nauphoetae TaxID=2049346 RepID=A0ABQ9X5H9_9EUKA|nr:putative 3-phosphoinositide-dependent protein kinase B [Blattamonas nauphoetae]
MGQDASKRSDFVKIKELGKGTFGTVELIEHIATKKTFACKSARFSTNQKALESIQDEIEAYKDLSNPFILKYYFSFKEEQIFYMLTEYCSRKDLAEFYKEARALTATVPPDRTWKFIFQMLIGLDYLLKKRMAHGDFKPQNVFLMENLDVRLGDFGSKQDAETTITDLERANGTEYGLSDDLWALGVTIYYLLTEKLPFRTHLMPDLTKQSSIYKLTDAEADPDIRDFTYFILDINAFTRPTAQDLLLSPNFTDIFKNSDESLKAFYTTDADFSIRQESRKISLSRLLVPELLYNHIDLFSMFLTSAALFSSENADTLFTEAATFWLHSSLAQHPQIVETFCEAFSSQIASSAQFVHSLPILHRNSLLSHSAFPFGVVHNALTTPSQTSINGSSFLSNFIITNKTLILQYVTVLSELVEHFARHKANASGDKSKKNDAPQPDQPVIKYKLKHVHLHLLHTFTALPLESFLLILHSSSLISLLNKILLNHQSPWMVHNPFFVKSALSLIKSYLMKFESSLILPEITPPELKHSWNCSIPRQLIQQTQNWVSLLRTGLNNAFSVLDVNSMTWTMDDPRQSREEQQVLVINMEIADLLLHSEKILKKTSSLLKTSANEFKPLPDTRLAEIETFTRSSTDLVGPQFRSSAKDDDFDPKAETYPWKLTHASIVHMGLTPPVLIHVLGQRVLNQLGKKDVEGETIMISRVIRWIQNAIEWRDARRNIEWNRTVETSVDSLTRNEKDEYASLLHETLCSYATLLNEQSIGEIEKDWVKTSPHFIALVGRVIVSILNSLSSHLVPDWKDFVQKPLAVFPSPTTPLQNSFSSPAFTPVNSPHVTQSPVVHPSNFNPVNQIPQVSTQQTTNLPYQPQNPQFYPNQQIQQQPNQQFLQTNYGYQSQQLIQPQQLPNPTIVNTFSTSAPTVLNATPLPTLMQTVRANQAPIQHVPSPTLLSTVQASQFPPSHAPPPTIVATVRGNPLANSPVPQPNTFGLGFQSPPSPMPTSPVVTGHYNPHAVQHSPLQNTYTPTPQTAQHSPLQNTYNPVTQTSLGFQTMQGTMQQNHQIAAQTSSVPSIASVVQMKDFITLPTTHLLSVSTPFFALLSLFFEKAQSSMVVGPSLAPLFALMCRSVTVIVQSLNKLDVTAPTSTETRSSLHQLLSSLLSCLTQFMKQAPIAQNSTAAGTTPQFILFTQTLFEDFVMSIAKLTEFSEAWNDRNTSPSFRPLYKRDRITDEAAESFNSFVTNYVSFVSAFSQFSSFIEEAMTQNNAIVNSFLSKSPDQQTTFRNSLIALADLGKKMSADCSESILKLHPTLQLPPFSSSPLHLEGEQISPLAHRYHLLKCCGDSIHTTATQCLLYHNCITGISSLSLMDSLSSFLLSENGHTVSKTLTTFERLCTTSGSLLTQSTVWSTINTALSSSFPPSAFPSLLRLLSICSSSQPLHTLSLAKQQLPLSTIMKYAITHNVLSSSQSGSSLLSGISSFYPIQFSTHPLNEEIEPAQQMASTKRTVRMKVTFQMDIDVGA